MTLNIISLFSGAGGLDIAACSTGMVRTLVSTDSNETFLKTTINNIPKHYPNIKHKFLAKDIRELDGRMLVELIGGKPDLIMGGPPCEDFSQFGRRLGMEGSKGPLIMEFLRLVVESRPKVFLFENVPNLASQFKVPFNEFLNEISKFGYECRWEILSASNYGSPTLRRRLFIVAWDLEHYPSVQSFCFPAPTHGEVNGLPKNSVIPIRTVRDVLYDLPDADIKGTSKYSNHTGRPHRPETIEYLKTVLQGKKGTKSYRYRAPWDGLCHSLTAGVDYATKSYIHPVYHREMSAREYARIQGFPDTWVFNGNHHNAVKQTANAVPLPMGTAVLKAVLNYIKTIKCTTEVES